MLRMYWQTVMYLPILHLPRVELRGKFKKKLHRVTGP